jgi:hypothetical protein
MKFYITEETRQEIEAKIEQLQHTEALRSFTIGVLLAEEAFYKRVLESATILPVEESWDTLHDKLLNAVVLPRKLKDKSFHEENYPNGVIICKK